MPFNLLRSLFHRQPASVAAPSVTTIAPASLREAVAHQELEAIGRRIDQLHERVSQIDNIEFWRYQAESTLLLERILAQPRYNDPLRLERRGLKVYSQNDEDGILAEIFRRIGTENRRFLEFGVENGLQNNTLCLLEQGWSGAWLEGYRDHVSAIENGFKRKIAAGLLSIREALVDRDNINYHVWEALTAIDPRVVVIEYNAKFPPPMRWVMGYDPAHRWDGTDQFGASLESLADLGRRKGYRLVGCNITGSNAFFVTSGLAEGRFAEPADAAVLYQPARYFLTSSFVSGHHAGYSRAQMP